MTNLPYERLYTLNTHDYPVEDPDRTRVSHGVRSTLRGRLSAKRKHVRKTEESSEQLSRQKIADNARTYEKEDENQRKHELIVLRILGYRSSREKLWKRALYFGR